MSRGWTRALCALAMTTAAGVALAPGAGAATNGPILFTTYDDIYSVRADGTGLKRISNLDVRNIAAAPDGKRFVATDGSLKLLKISGGKPKDLLKRYPTVRNLANTTWATWAPNGKQIAFIGENDQRTYLIKPNGKGLKYLFSKSRTGQAVPRWSPNGREIAFIDHADDSSLKIVDVKTRQERLVYSGLDPRAGTPVDFDFSPSGDQIAFYAPYRNWVINTDGTGLRQISPDAAFVSYENLSWAPDGSQIVGESSSDLYLLDGTFGAATGGYANELAPGFPESMFSPEWAPAPKRGK